MPRFLAVLLAALLLFLAPLPAHAAWPETGLAVGTGAGTQSLAALVADGLGGAFVAWSDAGAGLRVTHLDANGDAVAGWPVGGALLTGGTYLGASGDGANGIILFFVAPPVPDNGQGMRYRNFYGVRFTAEGQTPPGWSASGNVFRVESYSVMDDLGWEQVYVTHAMPWSQGGAVFFVRWYRDPGRAGCHAIAIPAAGTAANLWDFSLGPAGNNYYTVAPDSTGGFLVVRTAMDQVSVQRYSATGALLANRPVHNGYVQTWGYGLTLQPRQDALVWWTDPDYPGTWWSRLGDDLLPSAGWPGSYVSIPGTPRLVDGQGGVFASVNVSGTDYVDRLSLETSPPVSLWSPGPLPIDHGGTLVTDAQAGYFETWMPSGVYTTLRAVHYGADGALRTPWPLAGVPLTTTLQYNAWSPRTIPGGAGVAYAAWNDTRSGNVDVYVQRLADDAPVPAQASIVHADAFADRVELEWYLHALPDAPQVERSRNAGAWETVGLAEQVGRDLLRYVDRDVRGNETVEYQLRAGNDVLAGSDVFVFVPEAPSLALRGFVANPAWAGAEVEFALVGGAAARLELLDVAGRVLASRDVTAFGQGTHRTTFEGARAIEPGMVFVRLTEGSRTKAARAVMLR